MTHSYFCSPPRKKSALENSRCNALQRTATHCNSLQHTATHCNTLQHTYNALQHTTTQCNTLQHTATLILWLFRTHTAARTAWRQMLGFLYCSVLQCAAARSSILHLERAGVKVADAWTCLLFCFLSCEVAACACAPRLQDL